MTLDPATGNVLITGGDGNGNRRGVISGIDAVTIFDYRTETITKSAFGTTEFARWYPTNLTLASGETLMIGGRDQNHVGSGGDQGNNLESAVYNPTIRDPETNTLTQLADQALARLYHASALLLPDGTIWSGGGGAPGPLTNTNVEIFSPPCLHEENGTLADRPVIAGAPANIGAGQTFTFDVTDARAVETVSIIKSGALTHARNAAARFIDLDVIVVDDNTIQVSTPDANVMIPGLWMLFAVDQGGVPSEASMLCVNMAPVVDTPPLEQDGLVHFNIDAGAWRRVFDFGNGPASDNIWMRQVADSDDMAFGIYRDGRGYRITAVDAIVEGEIADWRVSVDAGGFMRMWTDGVLVAEGQGVVPADVDRALNHVDDSNWLTDTRLTGLVRNLEIVNEGDVPETDGQLPPRPMLPRGTPDGTSFFAEVAMRFDDTAGGVKYTVTAAGAIVDGEVAEGTAPTSWWPSPTAPRTRR